MSSKDKYPCLTAVGNYVRKGLKRVTSFQDLKEVIELFGSTTDDDRHVTFIYLLGVADSLIATELVEETRKRLKERTKA